MGLGSARISNAPPVRDGRVEKLRHKGTKTPSTVTRSASTDCILISVARPPPFETVK
jgi:hypothetical protein